MLRTRAARRPFLIAAAALCTGLAATACGSSSAPAKHSSQARATVSVAATASHQQLTQASITTADVAPLEMKVAAPLPDAALIWPYTAPVAKYGACAAVQEVQQAGEPGFRAATTVDLNVSTGADAITAVHLAAYRGIDAKSLLDAVATALTSCRSYAITGKDGRDQMQVTPLPLTVGDQSVAWAQTETYYAAINPQHPTAPMQQSFAVVRVGTTVITAELDASTAKGQLPAPNRALLTAQINKLRAVVH